MNMHEAPRRLKETGMGALDKSKKVVHRINAPKIAQVVLLSSGLVLVSAPVANCSFIEKELPEGGVELVSELRILEKEVKTPALIDFKARNEARIAEIKSNTLFIKTDEKEKANDSRHDSLFYASMGLFVAGFAVALGRRNLPTRLRVSPD